MKIRSITYVLLFVSTVLLSRPNHEYETSQSETIFIHGLNGSPKKLDILIADKIIHSPAKSFDLQNGRQCPLGQGQDIETVKKHIDGAQDCHVIGHSRGGAAAVSCLGKHNPANVKMLVLDAAPADMLNVIDEKQYKHGLFPFLTRSQKEWCLQQFHPNYPSNSTPPVEAIADIENKNLPVFIVHSHNDKVVNIRSAWQYYKAFKQANFPHVYLCELKQGGHNHNSNGPDSNIYKTALHSVYKKHEFQHDPELATLQNHEFKNLQPSIEEVDEKLRLNQWKLRQQIMINIGVGAVLGLCIALKRRK